MVSLQGRTSAVTVCRQVYERRCQSLGPDHPRTLEDLRNLGNAHLQLGELETGIGLLENALERRLSVLDPMDTVTLWTMHNVAIAYCVADRFPESIALHERALAALRRTHGDEYGTTIWCTLTFAQVCQFAGQLDRAEGLLREALETLRRQNDSINTRQATANARGWLALTLLLKRQPAAAEPLAREAVAEFEKQQPNSVRRFYWVSLLGDVLCAQGKYAEAEPLLLQGYEGMKSREAMLGGAIENRRLVEAGERVVRFYEATNQPDKARAWKDKLASPVRSHR